MTCGVSSDMIRLDVCGDRLSQCNRVSGLDRMGQRHGREGCQNESEGYQIESGSVVLESLQEG